MSFFGMVSAYPVADHHDESLPYNNPSSYQAAPIRHPIYNGEGYHEIPAESVAV